MAFHYQKLPHAVFDLLLMDPSLLGGPLMAYFALRRFLWTKVAGGTRRVCDLTQRGRAVASVGQWKVGASLGVGRQTVCRQLRVAKKEGWITVLPEKGRAALYELGTWGEVPKEIREDKTCKRPTFFFDVWLREFRREVLSSLQSSRPEGVTLSLRDFDMAARRDHVLGVLRMRKLAS